MIHVEVLELRRMSESMGNKIHSLKASKSESEIIEIIKYYVSKHFGTTWEGINIDSRKQDLVRSRHTIIYFIRAKTSLPLKAIAALFKGGKDHTTVMHACKAIRNLMDSNSNFRLQIEALNRVIDFNIEN